MWSHTVTRTNRFVYYFHTDIIIITYTAKTLPTIFWHKVPHTKATSFDKLHSASGSPLLDCEKLLWGHEYSPRQNSNLHFLVNISCQMHGWNSKRGYLILHNSNQWWHYHDDTVLSFLEQLKNARKATIAKAFAISHRRATNTSLPQTQTLPAPALPSSLHIPYFSQLPTHNPSLTLYLLTSPYLSISHLDVKLVYQRCWGRQPITRLNTVLWQRHSILCTGTAVEYSIHQTLPSKWKWAASRD